MIKRALHIAFFSFFTGIISPVIAQFINLQLTVEPELSAAVEQPLDFGTQITNSGPTEIELGDLNMGIFSIRAFSTQQVFIELNHPDYLEHTASAIDDRIPLNLSMSYNNSGKNLYQSAKQLGTNSGLIKVTETNTAITETNLWSILYIYVVGAIDVGNVTNGIYTADIVLSVEYE